MTKGCKAEDLSAKIQITWAEVQYAQICHATGITWGLNESFSFRIFDKIIVDMKFSHILK